MPILNPTYVTLTTLGFLNVILAWVAHKRIKRIPVGRRWLVLYLLLNCVYLGLRLGAEAGWWQPEKQWLAPDMAALLILTLVFYFLTKAFFRHVNEEPDNRRAFLILVPLISVVLLAMSVPRAWLPGPVGQFGGAIAGLIFWIAAYGKSALLVRERLIQSRRQPLHRNRVAYWVLITITFASADLLYFFRGGLVTELIRFAGIALAVYATLSLYLGDIQRLGRRIAGNLIAALFIGSLFSGGMGLLRLIGDLPEAQVGFALTMICGFLYYPSYRLVRRIASRVVPNMVNPSVGWIVGEYGHRISKLIELNRLEAEVIGLISQGMGLEHGTLFLVNQPAGDNPAYQFRSVQSSTEEVLILGTLYPEDPLAQYLSYQRAPLTQYEIDLLPRFQEGHDASRRWLMDMGIDVYVPIFAQNSWIGLLALGPKLSGQPYDRFELDLLATVADQTAVALENARLFDDLVVVNKELQEALARLEQANSKLQESDRLKSAFISVVSHELRTPFANVGFALNLIERYGIQDWQEGQQEEWHNLHKGIDQARKMVEDLVTFATFLSKQGQLNLTRIDFTELIAETAQIMEPLACQKRLQLRAGARAGDPFANGHAPRVNGDRERLADVLHHLVQNALKFTPEEGCIDLSFWTEGDRAYVAVQDNGIGIPADKLQSIWEGFNQMADPVRRGAEGLGLGLPLVMYVIRAHGGDVWADSELDQGSTFGFWIPLAGPDSSYRPTIPSLVLAAD